MSSIEHEDEGVREILSLMGMDGGEKPQQQPQKPAAKTTPAEALRWATENDLDPEWVTEAVMSDGELHEAYGHLPLGDRLMAAARHQAVLDALLESRYDDAVAAAGDDPTLLNRVVAEEGDILDAEEMTAWAIERLQEGESSRQEAIGTAYQKLLEERPELAQDAQFQSLLGSVDISQLQDGESARAAFESLSRVSDHVHHEEETAKLNRELLKATGVTDLDGESMYGEKVDLPEPDLEALTDPKALERIIAGDAPKLGDADDALIERTFAAVEEQADDWAAVQSLGADRRDEQLTRDAQLGRDTGGEDWGEEADS